MERLGNTIQPYAWGSHTAIAALQGRTRSERPEAELWMGAHPSAPSRIGGGHETLFSRIERDPRSTLGEASVARFGERLPYLFKVLAAAEPLSLQAHPSIAQAEEGFAREDSASIPRDAAQRNYRDRNHKPELLCALGPFVALCGFRAVEDTRALFATLGVEGLRALDLSDLRATFRTLMTTDVSRWVAETAAACARVTDGPFAREAEWCARLAAKYPGDAGVIGALLLNLVFLSEGEAIYLPAGNLHAYLQGVGVEIMANSDNVLRGGLTAKHVDVEELLRVLDFRAGPIAKVLPVRRGALEVWETPAEEFELARVRGSATVPIRAPVIVLCTEGSLVVDDGVSRETLGRGDSVFIAGSRENVAFAGDGTAYLATAVV